MTVSDSEPGVSATTLSFLIRNVDFNFNVDCRPGHAEMHFKRQSHEILWVVFLGSSSNLCLIHTTANRFYILILFNLSDLLNADSRSTLLGLKIQKAASSMMRALTKAAGNCMIVNCQLL